jgi:hypothetical protein
MARRKKFAGSALIGIKAGGKATAEVVKKTAGSRSRFDNFNIVARAKRSTFDRFNTKS